MEKGIDGINGKQKALREEEKKIIQQKKLIKPEEYKKKVEELRKKVIKLQKERASLMDTVSKQRIKARNELLKNLNPIISEYMKGKNIRMVIDKKNLILADKNVKGILINIFGGIMRCDVLAQGVVEAAKQVNLSVPLVVRLAGTNFKEGKEILDRSNLKILSASDLNDAAKKIVEAIK